MPLPAALGSERQRLGLWTTGSIYPDTCCFGGEVRAGPVCVRMRTGPLGCPQCVCVCVCVCAHIRACTLCSGTSGMDPLDTGLRTPSDRSESSQDHMLLPGPLPFPPPLSTPPLALEHSGCVCVSSSLFLILWMNLTISCPLGVSAPSSPHPPTRPDTCSAVSCPAPSLQGPGAIRSSAGCPPLSAGLRARCPEGWACDCPQSQPLADPQALLSAPNPRVPAR